MPTITPFILSGAMQESVKDVFQIGFILLLFIGILAGAFYTTRILAKYQMGRTKNANLKIIEALSVGPQKTVQLVRVGKEYLLIGVSKDHITMLKDISPESLDLLCEERAETVIPFKEYMEKVLKKRTNHTDKKS